GISPNLVLVSRAVNAVTDAVDRLNNTFNVNMKHDDFVSSIRDITSKLREMFAESTDVLGQMPEERRKEVEMTEALIGNDMRQMGKVVQQVVDNTNNPSYHIYRREVVRIAKEMAVNCTNFLSLFENRNRVKLPDFRAQSSMGAEYKLSQWAMLFASDLEANVHFTAVLRPSFSMVTCM
ncbi:hypothetical protein ANCDUO_17771, partial [Ancylostoma duodenale]